MESSIILKLVLVLVLIGINAYFVATEFALVAVRRTRIEQRLRGGDRRARYVAEALDHPDDFISAAQLGITVASIAIGYIAEDSIHALIVPYLEFIHFNLPLLNANITGHIISTILTLILVTYLHVVLGEQVPKMIAIQKAEWVALWTTRPTQIFGKVFRPFIRAMSGSAKAIMRIFGMQPTGVHSVAHSPEEIRMLVEQSQQEGEIEAEQEQMIHGVFEFPEILAREIMTPRPDIVALDVSSTMDEVLTLLIEEGHSRIPVYEENLDNIVGLLLVKDLLPYMAGTKGEAFVLRELLREPYFVPDTKRISELLAELRSRSVHLAIVLDEFGGTEGIVTMEDLLEEIVGEIYDEYDVAEPDFTVTPEGDVIIDGGASIDEVNERFGMNLSSEDFDTIGGFIFGTLGRVPQIGDSIHVDGSGDLRVEGTEERRVTAVRLIPSRRKKPREVDAGEEVEAEEEKPEQEELER
ncbi:MAG TPA: hemolysin family protein [Longimicrobiales bacterium]|nr:hemolysin family protein [Longimicrobiales bacterium]